MRSYNDQLDNYGFLTWRDDEKGKKGKEPPPLVEGDKKCGKTTKNMKDGDKLITTGKYSWWKSLFRRSNSSPSPNISQNQLQRHLSDQDLASDVSVRRRQRKNKLRSSSRKCRSVLLDAERLKLNEIDLEGYGDYCTIDLSAKAKKDSPLPAEKSGEQEKLECVSVTVKEKLYPELLPVEVDPGGNVKHETTEATSKIVDKLEDKLKDEKEEERSRNRENNNNKRKVRFDFRRSFSLNRKKISKSSGKCPDPITHKEPYDSPIPATSTSPEKGKINADESWNKKYPCEKRSRSQRKVLVHIHTKEEIAVENGVPQWGDRPQKFDEGIRINGVLVLTETSRSSEDTEDDDEAINKEVNVTDSLKRNLLPSGLTVMAEIHTPDQEDKSSLTKRRSMTLPKPTIIGARKESLHRSIKGENGSLRKLNLLQFERSTQNELENSAKFGRFFAITGITTTTDYEFLEFTNRKNKRRELKIKHPEITSAPIKSMAHCLRQASKYKKPSLAKPPRQHKPKSSKPIPSNPTTPQQEKKQSASVHHNFRKSHTSHLLPECLNGSRKWYSESDLSSMCVTPLKLAGKVVDQVQPEKENSESRVGDQRMTSDKFLRRIRTRLERIEKLKNIANTSKASSLQDLSSCASTPRREPENKLPTDRFKEIINTRLNSTTPSAARTATKARNQLPAYKAGATQTLLRRSHSIRPKMETDLDEMLKYSCKARIEEPRHGVFSVVGDGNRRPKDDQISNNFEFSPLHRPHIGESPCTIPSNGSPACSLDSYDDLLPAAKSVQTSISGHSCSSSYTGNDPIMNTMLDAMRKISVKYSSRDCILNQSSSCASSTSNEDNFPNRGPPSAVPPLRLRHQATRSHHRPHSSYEPYTKFRQHPPRRLVDAGIVPKKQSSVLRRVGDDQQQQQQLELADVRNFMHWDCDETDL